MFRSVLAHVRAQWMGALALFLVIAGGTAYAANTIGSSDIIDESIQSVDLKNGEVRSSDLGNNQVQSIDVRDDTLTGTDVLEGSLGAVPSVAPGGVKTSAIRNKAVTPGKLGTVPAVNTVNTTGPETTNTSQTKVLHGNVDIYDTANVHDEAAASENLVAPVDGMYAVSATVLWAPNGSGYRTTTITGPSGDVAAVIGSPSGPVSATSQNPSGLERLAAGQAVRVEVQQGSGGDLDARLKEFQMTMVGGY